MRVRLSIVSKLTALVVGAVVLTAVAVSEFYLRASDQILIERAIVDLQKEAEFFKYPLTGKIGQLRDDVSLLANLPVIRAIVRATANGGQDPETRVQMERLHNSLAATFTEMLRTRSYYRQIRFIGVADGKEIIRVQHFGTRIERTPDSQRQDRSGATYFIEPLLLAPGDVYLSEADLNKERGSVSFPHTLVLRAAVPVLADNNEPVAVVVINLDLGKVLGEIRQQLTASHGVYVVNATGDYLINPDFSRLFATDLGHDRRIQRDRPQLIPIMGDPKQEKATFVPESAGGNVLAFKKYLYDPLKPGNYVGIAIEAPYAEIIATTRAVRTQGLMLSSIIACLAGSAGIILLRLFIRPLNRVAEAVVRYRTGEKDIALPVTSPDEVGILAREFAGMIQQKNEEDWVKETLVAISQTMLGFKELPGFAAKLMEVLTPAVGAQVGVLYFNESFLGPASPGELSFNIGVTVNTIAASTRTQDLLKQSRQTTEELKRHEAELKTKQEELEASNGELQEKTARGEQARDRGKGARARAVE